MSIPHSSDRPCHQVAGQTRGSLRTALAGSALAVAALFGTVALVQPAPVHAQAVRQLPDFTGLVEKTGGAVVNIRTTEHAGNVQGQGGEELLDPDDPFFEFFRRFFPPGAIPNMPGNPQGRQRQVPPGQSGEEIPRGLGSGFIISADGYVMTNHHVVDGADEIYVTLTDKREFKAKLIGSDKNTDVALLKIDAANLPVLPIGDPNKLRVGEWVLAIGSPFGLDNTVTAGIVSAKARETGDYLPFIQTDVAVNPGNSGGPLINMDGQAVGINSQIYSRTGGFMGISFAIPINVAVNVADQLKATGKVQRGQLGVVIQEVSFDLAKSFGLDKPAGALVAKVVSGSPAEQGGIQVGDIIRSVNGSEVRSSGDLPMTISSLAPGQTVKLGVWRKGKLLEIAVKLGNQGEASAKAEREKAGRGNSIGGFEFAAAGLSLTVESDNSIVVSGAKGIAYHAGLRRGDILLEVGGRPVHSQDDFNAAVAEAGKNIPMLVKRGGNTLFLAVILP